MVVILRRLRRIWSRGPGFPGAGLLGLALLAAVPAAATTARIAALGGRPDFFTDDAETRRWCAALADYPDLVTIDSGRFDPGGGYHDQWGSLVSGPGVGLNADLGAAGRRGTVGLLLTARRQDADPGSLNNNDLAGYAGVIYARRFGSTTVALGYGRAGDTTTQAGGSTGGVLKTTRTDLGGGLRMDLGPKVMLDLGGELRGISQSSSSPVPGAPVGNQDSWRSFGLRGRAFVQLGQRVALVPVAEYIHEKFHLLQDVEGSLDNAPLDRELVHLGLGLDFFPDPDNMLVCSGEWLTGSDNARYTLPADSPAGQLIDQAVVFRLAFETRLNPWLTARAATGLETVTRDSPSGNLDADHVPLSLGLSLSVLRMTLDLAVSDRLPQTITRLAIVSPEDEDSTWVTVDFRYGFGP